jgi:hypothetical protein
LWHSARHISIVDETGKVLPRAGAEGLLLLWRVDPVESDLVLPFVAVEDRDGVAVSDCNDAAFYDPRFRSVYRAGEGRGACCY